MDVRRCDSEEPKKVPGLDDLFERVTGVERPVPPKGPKIRCPLCLWQPKKRSRWYCTCGHGWNTFDTAGRCPKCTFQWVDTACLSCARWSKHRAWYAPDDEGRGTA